MGQFKPMVKMMTTEPSVILKLKKGGKVAHKMDGGYMPMQSTMPAQAMPARGGLAPAASPMKPSMAARRKAMMAKPAMNPNLLMKKGGKADMHEDAAQDRAMIKKALAGKKFATGGVVNGQGGFKKGGNVKMASGGNIDDDVKNAKSGLYMQKDDDKVYSKVRGLGPGMAARRLEDRGVDVKGLVGNRANPEDRGSYKDGGIIKSTKGETKMVTSKVDHSPAKTGGVKLGNGGGYATGGVAKANGGGYKMGGSAKKAYATGGTVDTGKPVAMPKKPASKPVANTMQSGTFAKGGKVEKAEKPNLRLIKTYTGPKGHVAKVYKDRDWQEYRTKFYTPDGKYLTEGDSHTDDAEDAHSTAKNQVENSRYKHGGTAKRYNSGGSTVDASKGAYDKSIGPSEEDMDMAKAIRSVPRKLFEGAKSMMGMTPKPAGSVTKTEKSVTVTPAGKKRGGGC